MHGGAVPFLFGKRRMLLLGLLLETHYDVSGLFSPLKLKRVKKLVFLNLAARPPTNNNSFVLSAANKNSAG